LALRGVWNGTTITPLERPANQPKDVLSEDEARRGETGGRRSLATPLIADDRENNQCDHERTALRDGHHIHRNRDQHQRHRHQQVIDRDP